MKVLFVGKLLWALFYQSEFISDSNFIELSRAISCRTRNRVRMSLRGKQQFQNNYFLVFVGLVVMMSAFQNLNFIIDKPVN